jgi:predicted RNA-binding Zn ribbon-like protein
MRRSILRGDAGQIAQMERVEAVNKLLRQYEARPRLRLPSPFGGGLRLEWRCAGRPAELNAVLVAVELARQGCIASLKECPNPTCSRWFFARFSHQRFCSEDCKAFFKKVDPQEKAKRRDWAKEHYWTQRRTNVK